MRTDTTRCSHSTHRFSVGLPDGWKYPSVAASQRHLGAPAPLEQRITATRAEPIAPHRPAATNIPSILVSPRTTTTKHRLCISSPFADVPPFARRLTPTPHITAFRGLKFVAVLITCISIICVGDMSGDTPIRMDHDHAGDGDSAAVAEQLRRQQFTGAAAKVVAVLHPELLESIINGDGADVFKTWMQCRLRLPLHGCRSGPSTSRPSGPW